MNSTTDKVNDGYAQAFQQWRQIASEARARGERIDRSIHERGWALAMSVGIGRCCCSLHNASIDDAMTGWCHNNPQRLKVAKQANYLVNQWPGSRMADKAIKSAWNRLIAVPFGFKAYDIE